MNTQTFLQIKSFFDGITVINVVHAAVHEEELPWVQCLDCER